MGRRHNRPFDPASAERARLARLDKAAAARASQAYDDAHPERWGASAEALAQPANREVLAHHDGRGRVLHAHRSDVFERLHARGGLSDGQLAAVRRLERDVGLRAGLFRTPVDLVKIDAQAKTDGATQRMLEAGRRVDMVLAAAGLVQARLLRALIEPAMTAGAAPDWRDVVARETGETDLRAQAAMVRTACDNLMAAYQAGDHKPWRATG